MPAFLTHWHVLIETAQRSQDAGSDLGSLIIDKAAFRRREHGWVVPPQTTPAGAVWHTGPLPEIDFSFPGSDISSMAYLGALAPDITYFRAGSLKEKMGGRRAPGRSTFPANKNICWADILHTIRSGDMLLAFLELIANVPSPALRSQALAFAMGYLSHIATDIAFNPCINVLATTYSRSDIPGIFAPLDMRAYVELCLDEYIASTYFDHPLYTWTNQPWRSYIEPAAQNIVAGTTLTARVLDLFTAAAEATYNFSEEQHKTFHADHLTGLQALRRYLAGRGFSRLLAWRALSRKRAGDPIMATIVVSSQSPDTMTFEAVRAYAIRLSERLCRRAISYYSALRNVNASAAERSQRRTLLCDDLRNWHLSTGYTLAVTFDEGITLHVAHNWLHFAELWEQSRAETSNRPQASLNH